jgi:hypothetical protein
MSLERDISFRAHLYTIRIFLVEKRKKGFCCAAKGRTQTHICSFTIRTAIDLFEHIIKKTYVFLWALRQNANLSLYLEHSLLRMFNV